ncbi:MAG: hypothetical protein MRY74_02430 [Neomegalonema sp.]|nr:hypothetical protein [Neomegalonema sp.]
MRLRPLDRDYWPEDARQPLFRLGVAIVVTPLLLSAGFTLLLMMVAWFGPYSRPLPFGGPVDMFIELALELYAFAIFSVGPAFAALWSLRLRSRSSFLVAGLVGGVLGAGATALRFGGLTMTHALIALLLGVILLLTLRSLAGVRASERDR